MTDTPATSPTTPTTELMVAQGNELALLSVTIKLGILAVADGTLSNDHCAEIHDARCAIKRMVKELDTEAEAAFVTRLKAHGDIDLGGGRRLYAAPSKTTKSKDNKATMAVLIDLYGGDVVGMTECLSAEPFKYGAMRKVAQDSARFAGVCDDLFETVITSKTAEGKAKNRVQIADNNFKG